MRIEIGARLLAMQAFAVLAAGGYAGAAAAEPATAERGLLTDAEGAMEHVVCVANSARRALLHNAALVTEILNALPDRVRVTLLTNDRGAFQFRKERVPGRVDFVALPQDAVFTIWPQDPFVVLKNGSGNELLESASFPRADDHRLSEAVAANLGLGWRQSRLAFQGGNLVTGSHRVFVGADTIRLNALRLGISDEAAVRVIEVELGKPVLVLGPYPQVVGHVDMIVTPMGGDRVVVADARWGVRVAREILRTDGDQARQFEEEIQARLGTWVEGPTSSESIVPLRPLSLEQLIETSEDLAPHLDGVAAGLIAHGCAVHRVPYLGPLAAGSRRKGHGGSRVPVDSLQRPGLPYLSYNNVLLEEVDGLQKVYLPQYGWEGMDRAGREAWESLRCEVIGVGGLLGSAMHGGSLRCCVKVLRRR